MQRGSPAAPAVMVVLLSVPMLLLFFLSLLPLLLQLLLLQLLLQQLLLLLHLQQEVSSPISCLHSVKERCFWGFCL